MFLFNLVTTILKSLNDFSLEIIQYTIYSRKTTDSNIKWRGRFWRNEIIQKYYEFVWKISAHKSNEIHMFFKIPRFISTKFLQSPPPSIFWQKAINNCYGIYPVIIFVITFVTWQLSGYDCLRMIINTKLLIGARRIKQKPER